MNLTDYNEIRALLNRHKFRFSKSMGQNFLTAAWVPEDIAASAGLEEDVGVLEIGPGVGCLTRELSKRAGRVLSIELDKALKPILAETLADCGNVEIVYGNALKLDLPGLVRERMPGMRYAVCANLPYNVTTPVLTALIEADCFQRVTVMIQREVARRICAPAGAEDYGAFGIFVQWYMEPELLFDVPPSCFVPQPKVTSSVIRLTRRLSPPVGEVAPAVRDMMFRVVRAAFNQRRKTLVNALSSQLPEVTKESAERALLRCGLDPRVRGEVLATADFVRLAEELIAQQKEDF